ncbi:MAG TPA: hypothetical protein VF278_16405 [Pirellulales bacterium]
MRLSIAIAVSLFAVGTAAAQSDQNEGSYPPASGEARGYSGPAMPAWQALPAGYGGWHGGGESCCDSCCGSGDSCCHHCRPGLIRRLKSLKCRMCSRWQCRRACRHACGSCCGSSGSCCEDGAVHEVPAHQMPMPSGHDSMLPVPPAENTPYTDDADEAPAKSPVHRPTSTRTKVKKQRYSMPRVTSASKSTKNRKQR